MRSVSTGSLRAAMDEVSCPRVRIGAATGVCQTCRDAPQPTRGGAQRAEPRPCRAARDRDARRGYVDLAARTFRDRRRRRWSRQGEPVRAARSRSASDRRHGSEGLRGIGLSDDHRLGLDLASDRHRTGYPRDRGVPLLVPDADTVTNNLHGYEDDGLDPLTWQRATPLFQERAARGRPTFVVSLPGFSGTGFTQATVRGAQFRPAASPAERVAIASDLASTTPGALIYLYFRELDHIGHARGWESDEWSEQLESIDALLLSWNSAAAQGPGSW